MVWFRIQYRGIYDRHKVFNFTLCLSIHIHCYSTFLLIEPVSKLKIKLQQILQCYRHLGSTRTWCCEVVSKCFSHCSCENRCLCPSPAFWASEEALSKTSQCLFRMNFLVHLALMYRNKTLKTSKVKNKDFQNNNTLIVTCQTAIILSY